MRTLMTPVLLSAVIAAGATFAGESQPEPDSSTAEPEFQVIDSTEECRAKFPTYLEDFGFNPFSHEGHEDPRPIKAGTSKALIDNILNATRDWVVDERFDRCVSVVCACVLKIPGREYAVFVSDCEETPGVIDHRVAIVYFSDPDLKRVDVVKWYTHCAQPPDSRTGDVSTDGSGASVYLIQAGTIETACPGPRQPGPWVMHTLYGSRRKADWFALR